jgi:alpha-L-fucosidase 2
MEWNNGQVTRAVVRSQLGGNCRIRTNESVQVIGASSKSAAGDNPNAFFSIVNPGPPLVSDASQLPKYLSPSSISLDFDTSVGGTYVLVKE